MAIDDTDYWLDWALDEAVDGNRNNTAFRLACQLRDNQIPRREAEATMREYAQYVNQYGSRFTEREAISALRSAWSQPSREPSGEDEHMEMKKKRTETIRDILRRIEEEPETVTEQERRRVSVYLPSPPSPTRKEVWTLSIEDLFRDAFQAYTEQDVEQFATEMAKIMAVVQPMIRMMRYYHHNHEDEYIKYTESIDRQIRPEDLFEKIGMDSFTINTCLYTMQKVWGDELTSGMEIPKQE